MRNRLSTLVCLLAILPFFAVTAHAQQAGQEDLDKATELRLSARTPSDFQKVAQLCEAAIRKGLADEDQKFAKQLAAGAMFDLGSRLASTVLDAKQPDPRWQFFRHTALQSLEKAIEYDPDLAEAYLLVGRLQQMPGGKKERSIETVAKAVELLEKSGKNDMLAEAYVLRARLGEKAEERLEDFKRAFKADPTNSDALEGQAKVLMSMGKSDDALGVFAKLLESAKDKVRVRITIAEALAGMERYDDAMEEATKAIQADERNSGAWTLRARIHALKEDAKSALKDLDKALEVDPQNFQALLIRFELNLVESNYAKARKDVATMLAANPRLALPYQLRSRVASAEAQKAKDEGKKTLSRKKFAEAARDMRLLLQNDPNNNEWRLQLASIYSTDDQPRRAIREIDKVILKDDKSWLAYRTRGDALLSIGDHKKAIADYEKALELRPKNSGILNNLAWVLATSPKDEVRDGKRAIELAQKACEITKYKESHILSTLASGYAEIGDFETARKWSKKAVETGRDDLKDQLQEELESYKKEKVWREVQETEENPDFEEPKGEVIDT